MEKRKLRGESVSLLGFGCMRFPVENRKIDIAQTEKMIDLAISSGVNYFDTAYPYHGGKSETTLGLILKNYQREKLYIADKFPPWLLNSPSSMGEIFKTQLTRLGTDYVDFYLLHSLDRGIMDKINNMKVYEHFTREKEKGRIKYLGFSFHDTPEALEKILSLHDWDFVQIQMNYLDWTYQNAKKSYELLAERSIPVVVMEPIRGGFLANPAPHISEFIKNTGITPAALALRWVSQFENVKVILSGMSSLEQVRENISIFGGYTPVTQEEIKTAEAAVEMINQIKAIPCTGCGYCMDCPSGVDIPELFKIYNHNKAVGDDFRTGHSYRYQFDQSKKPENCTGCNKCVSRCPQHIDIPVELSKVKTRLNAL